MIACTMTSWPKRIGNCAKVIETLLGQTVPPDRVFLNLCRDEFRGVELPQDLVGLVTDDLVTLNWVDGPNTKTMKKVFPILQYLNPEDYILNMDDDILYPKGLIESRLDEFGRYHSPITTNNNPEWHYKAWLDAWVCGPGSLMQALHLFGWDAFVNEEVIRTYNDDETYMTILYLNGYKFRPAERFGKVGPDRIRQTMSNDPFGKGGGYLWGDATRNVFERRCLEITGRPLKECYGWNKKVCK